MSMNKKMSSYNWPDIKNINSQHTNSNIEAILRRLDDIYKLAPESINALTNIILADIKKFQKRIELADKSDVDIWQISNMPRFIYRQVKNNNPRITLEYINALIGGQILNPNSVYIERATRILKQKEETK